MNNIINIAPQNLKKQPKVICFLEKMQSIYGISIANIIEKKNISYDDFKEILFRCNGIIRELNKKERGVISESVYIEGTFNQQEKQPFYLPPKNKEVYLKKLYDIFINNDFDTNFQAQYLYYVLQYIHIFSDGNRRTGRLVKNLLENGDDFRGVDWHYTLKDMHGLGSFGIEDRIKIIKQIDDLALENYLKKEDITPSRFYTFLDFSPYPINRELQQDKNYEKAQKILDANSIGKKYSFRVIMLYLINKRNIHNNSNKYYEKLTGNLKRKVKKREKLREDFFNGKTVLDNLTSSDLQFIIDEYNKFEQERMNIVITPEEMKRFIVA